MLRLRNGRKNVNFAVKCDNTPKSMEITYEEFLRRALDALSYVPNEQQSAVLGALAKFCLRPYYEAELYSSDRRCIGRSLGNRDSIPPLTNIIEDYATFEIGLLDPSGGRIISTLGIVAYLPLVCEIIAERARNCSRDYTVLQSLARRLNGGKRDFKLA